MLRPVGERLIAQLKEEMNRSFEDLFGENEDTSRGPAADESHDMLRRDGRDHLGNVFGDETRALEDGETCESEAGELRNSGPDPTLAALLNLGNVVGDLRNIQWGEESVLLGMGLGERDLGNRRAIADVNANRAGSLTISSGSSDREPGQTMSGTPPGLAALEYLAEGMEGRDEQLLVHGEN